MRVLSPRRSGSRPELSWAAPIGPSGFASEDPLTVGVGFDGSAIRELVHETTALEFARLILYSGELSRRPRCAEK